jgi:tight adherence protein C
MSIVAILFWLLIVATLALAVGYFVWNAMHPRQLASIEDRLTSFAERPRTLEELELEQPFLDRAIKPIVNAFLTLFGKLSPAKEAERVKLNLMYAGNPGGMTAAQFIGLRALAGISMLVISLLLFFVISPQDTPASALLYTVVLTMLGYLTPTMWLGQKIRARKTELMRALPDAIDLLTVCVEAGLGLDLAMTRVAEKWDKTLSLEFQKVVSEIKVGKARREALREMGRRTGVPEVNTFIASLVQAEQLGVSIAKVLRIQSDQMRIRRRQIAEEKARRAPVLMLLPLAFLIFPAIYIIILGPSVPQFLNGGL